MFRLTALIYALSVAAALPVHAQDMQDCILTTGNAPPNAPKFSDYPAHVWQGKPARVQQITTIAKMYRTAIRGAQKEGPDFAGHYKIATWGCGASCTDWAVVDAKSGQVFDFKTYRVVSHIYVADEPLDYRPDSRLLIIKGAANEDESRDGITYLLWTGTSFRQIGFYAKREYCLPLTFATP